MGSKIKISFKLQKNKEREGQKTRLSMAELTPSFFKLQHPKIAHICTAISDIHELKKLIHRAEILLKLIF